MCIIIIKTRLCRSKCFQKLTCASTAGWWFPRVACVELTGLWVYYTSNSNCLFPTVCPAYTNGIFKRNATPSYDLFRDFFRNTNILQRVFVWVYYIWCCYCVHCLPMNFGIYRSNSTCPHCSFVQTFIFWEPVPRLFTHRPQKDKKNLCLFYSFFFMQELQSHVIKYYILPVLCGQCCLSCLYYSGLHLNTFLMIRTKKYFPDTLTSHSIYSRWIAFRH